MRRSSRSGFTLIEIMIVVGIIAILVVVLVAVLAGGAAFGMFGFLMALPLVATAVILAKEFVLPPLREWADEPESKPEPSAPARSAGKP